MTTIALSVHLVGGDRAEVTYQGPDHADADRVIEHLVSTLARDSGAVHCRRNDRLVVVFGRGVAAVEITEPAPKHSSAGQAV